MTALEQELDKRYPMPPALPYPDRRQKDPPPGWKPRRLLGVAVRGVQEETDELWAQSAEGKKARQAYSQQEMAARVRGEERNAVWLQRRFAASHLINEPRFWEEMQAQRQEEGRRQARCGELKQERDAAIAAAAAEITARYQVRIEAAYHGKES